MTVNLKNARKLQQSMVQLLLLVVSHSKQSLLVLAIFRITVFTVLQKLISVLQILVSVLLLPVVETKVEITALLLLDVIIMLLDNMVLQLVVLIK
jgi:hypothetical protein